MKNRMIVKLTASEYGIVFRTVSQATKSRNFYVLRSDLAELGHNKNTITLRDRNSYATFFWDMYAGTVTISFAWLTLSDEQLTGYTESIVLPYADLAYFVKASQMGKGPKHIKILSIDPESVWSRLRLCDIQWLHK